MVGNLILVFLEIYWSFQQWKNFANPPRIDKLIAMVRVAPFFWLTVYVFGNLFAQPLSMSSLVYLLVWSPPPHIPYIFFTQKHKIIQTPILHFRTNYVAAVFGNWSIKVYKYKITIAQYILLLILATGLQLCSAL